MVILVGVPGSKGVRRAHPLAERQYGALGSAGLTLRRKGGVVALTGFCRMILSQLSLWFGVLATRIPACTSLRSRGLSCGCWSVFPSIMRHHGGIAPIVSLVGCTSLMSSHFLCLISVHWDFWCPVFCSLLSYLSAKLLEGRHRLFLALCHLTRAQHIQVFSTW